MSRLLQPLWLLLSFGLAFGLNHVLRPRVSYELPLGERTIATGWLRFEDAGGPLELKLVTVRVIATQIRRPLAAPISVRELCVRSPEQGDQAAPDLELFAGLPDAEAHDVRPLEQRELKLQPVAPASTLRSRLRLPGAERHARLSDGTFVIDELLPTETPGTFRAQGRVELFLRDGDNERRLSGRFSARLISD